MADEPSTQQSGSGDTPPAPPAQPTANPVQQAANSAQPVAPNRPSGETSAAALLTQVHTAISALPEQLAKVLAEQNPKRVEPAASTATSIKQEPAKQEPAKTSAEPQKKTFAERWFGL